MQDASESQREQQLLKDLINETVWLDREWRVCKAILENGEYQEIFHAYAGTVRTVFKWMFRRDICCLISRLFDKSSTPVPGGARENRSLYSLHLLLDQNQPLGFDAWSSELDRLKVIVCKRIKPFRDKVCAHLDNRVLSSEESIEYPCDSDIDQMVLDLKNLLCMASMMTSDAPIDWSIYNKDIKREVFRFCSSAALRGTQR